jgi:hypothetical protein
MSFLSFVELIEIFIVAFILSCQKSAKVINSFENHSEKENEKEIEKEKENQKQNSYLSIFLK